MEPIILKSEPVDNHGNHFKAMVEFRPNHDGTENPVLSLSEKTGRTAGKWSWGLDTMSKMFATSDAVDNGVWLDFGQQWVVTGVKAAVQEANQAIMAMHAKPIQPANEPFEYDVDVDDGVITAAAKSGQARDMRCHDCKVDYPDEWFMLEQDVWDAATQQRHDLILCVGCLEKRLGRKLNQKDFQKIPLNFAKFFDKYRSQRLRERLVRTAQADDEDMLIDLQDEIRREEEAAAIQRSAPRGRGFVVQRRLSDGWTDLDLESSPFGTMDTAMVKARDYLARHESVNAEDVRVFNLAITEENQSFAPVEVFRVEYRTGTGWLPLSSAHNVRSIWYATLSEAEAAVQAVVRNRTATAADLRIVSSVSGPIVPNMATPAVDPRRLVLNREYDVVMAPGVPTSFGGRGILIQKGPTTVTFQDATGSSYRFTTTQVVSATPAVQAPNPVEGRMTYGVVPITQRMTRSHSELREHVGEFLVLVTTPALWSGKNALDTWPYWWNNFDDGIQASVDSLRISWTRPYPNVYTMQAIDGLDELRRHDGWVEDAGISAQMEAAIGRRPNRTRTAQFEEPDDFEIEQLQHEVRDEADNQGQPPAIAETPAPSAPQAVTLEGEEALVDEDALRTMLDDIGLHLDGIQSNVNDDTEISVYFSSNEMDGVATPRTLVRLEDLLSRLPGATYAFVNTQAYSARATFDRIVAFASAGGLAKRAQFDDEDLSIDFADEQQVTVDDARDALVKTLPSGERQPDAANPAEPQEEETEGPTRWIYWTGPTSNYITQVTFMREHLGERHRLGDKQDKELNRALHDAGCGTERRNGTNPFWRTIYTTDESLERLRRSPVFISRDNMYDVQTNVSSYSGPGQGVWSGHNGWQPTIDDARRTLAITMADLEEHQEGKPPGVQHWRVVDGTGRVDDEEKFLVVQRDNASKFNQWRTPSGNAAPLSAVFDDLRSALLALHGFCDRRPEYRFNDFLVVSTKEGPIRGGKPARLARTAQFDDEFDIEELKAEVEAESGQPQASPNVDPRVFVERLGLLLYRPAALQYLFNKHGIDVGKVKTRNNSNGILIYLPESFWRQDSPSAMPWEERMPRMQAACDELRGQHPAIARVSVFNGNGIGVETSQKVYSEDELARALADKSASTNRRRKTAQLDDDFDVELANLQHEIKDEGERPLAVPPPPPPPENGTRVVPGSLTKAVLNKMSRILRRMGYKSLGGDDVLEALNGRKVKGGGTLRPKMVDGYIWDEIWAQVYLEAIGAPRQRIASVRLAQIDDTDFDLELADLQHEIETDRSLQPTDPARVERQDGEFFLVRYRERDTGILSHWKFVEDGDGNTIRHDDYDAALAASRQFAREHQLSVDNVHVMSTTRGIMPSTSIPEDGNYGVQQFRPIAGTSILWTTMLHEDGTPLRYPTNEAATAAANDFAFRSGADDGQYRSVYFGDATQFQVLERSSDGVRWQQILEFPNANEACAAVSRMVAMGNGSIKNYGISDEVRGPIEIFQVLVARENAWAPAGRLLPADVFMSEREAAEAARTLQEWPRQTRIAGSWEGTRMTDSRHEVGQWLFAVRPITEQRATSMELPAGTQYFDVVFVRRDYWEEHLTVSPREDDEMVDALGEMDAINPVGDNEHVLAAGQVQNVRRNPAFRESRDMEMVLSRNMQNFTGLGDGYRIEYAFSSTPDPVGVTAWHRYTNRAGDTFAPAEAISILYNAPLWAETRGHFPTSFCIVRVANPRGDTVNRNVYPPVAEPVAAPARRRTATTYHVQYRPFGRDAADWTTWRVLSSRQRAYRLLAAYGGLHPGVPVDVRVVDSNGNVLRTATFPNLPRQASTKTAQFDEPEDFEIEQLQQEVKVEDAARNQQAELEFERNSMGLIIGEWYACQQADGPPFIGTFTGFDKMERLKFAKYDNPDDWVSVPKEILFSAVPPRWFVEYRFPHTSPSFPEGVWDDAGWMEEDGSPTGNVTRKTFATRQEAEQAIDTFIAQNNDREHVREKFRVSPCFPPNYLPKPRTTPVAENNNMTYVTMVRLPAIRNRQNTWVTLTHRHRLDHANEDIDRFVSNAGVGRGTYRIVRMDDNVVMREVPPDRPDPELRTAQFEEPDDFEIEELKDEVDRDDALRHDLMQRETPPNPYRVMLRGRDDKWISFIEKGTLEEAQHALDEFLRASVERDWEGSRKVQIRRDRFKIVSPDDKVVPQAGDREEGPIRIEYQDPNGEWQICEYGTQPNMGTATDNCGVLMRTRPEITRCRIINSMGDILREREAPLWSTVHPDSQDLLEMHAGRTYQWSFREGVSDAPEQPVTGTYVSVALRNGERFIMFDLDNGGHRTYVRLSDIQEISELPRQPRTASTGRQTRKAQFEPDDFEIEQLQAEVDDDHAQLASDMAAPTEPSVGNVADVASDFTWFKYSGPGQLIMGHIYQVKAPGKLVIWGRYLGQFMGTSERAIFQTLDEDRRQFGCEPGASVRMVARGDQEEVDTRRFRPYCIAYKPHEPPFATWVTHACFETVEEAFARMEGITHDLRPVTTMTIAVFDMSAKQRMAVDISPRPSGPPVVTRTAQFEEPEDFEIETLQGELDQEHQDNTRFRPTKDGQPAEVGFATLHEALDFISQEAFDDLELDGKRLGVMDANTGNPVDVFLVEYRHPKWTTIRWNVGHLSHPTLEQPLYYATLEEAQNAIRTSYERTRSIVSGTTLASYRAVKLPAGTPIPMPTEEADPNVGRPYMPPYRQQRYVSRDSEWVFIDEDTTYANADEAWGAFNIDDIAVGEGNLRRVVDADGEPLPRPPAWGEEGPLQDEAERPPLTPPFWPQYYQQSSSRFTPIQERDPPRRIHDTAESAWQAADAYAQEHGITVAMGLIRVVDSMGQQVPRPGQPADWSCRVQYRTPTRRWEPVMRGTLREEFQNANQAWAAIIDSINSDSNGRSPDQYRVVSSEGATLPDPWRSSLFSQLRRGDTFDFVGPTTPSFFDRCTKVGNRQYMWQNNSSTVGSPNVMVYHVTRNRSETPDLQHIPFAPTQAAVARMNPGRTYTWAWRANAPTSVTENHGAFVQVIPTRNSRGQPTMSLEFSSEDGSRFRIPTGSIRRIWGVDTNTTASAGGMRKKGQFDEPEDFEIEQLQNEVNQEREDAAAIASQPAAAPSAQYHVEQATPNGQWHPWADAPFQTSEDAFRAINEFVAEAARPGERRDIALRFRVVGPDTTVEYTPAPNDMPLERLDGEYALLGVPLRTNHAYSWELNNTIPAVTEREMRFTIGILSGIATQESFGARRSAILTFTPPGEDPIELLTSWIRTLRLMGTENSQISQGEAGTWFRGMKLTPREHYVARIRPDGASNPTGAPTRVVFLGVSGNRLVLLNRDNGVAVGYDGNLIYSIMANGEYHVEHRDEESDTGDWVRLDDNTFATIQEAEDAIDNQIVEEDNAGHPRRSRDRFRVVDDDGTPIDRWTTAASGSTTRTAQFEPDDFDIEMLHREIEIDEADRASRKPKYRVMHDDGPGRPFNDMPLLEYDSLDDAFAAIQRILEVSMATDRQNSRVVSHRRDEFSVVDTDGNVVPSPEIVHAQPFSIEHFNQEWLLSGLADEGLPSVEEAEQAVRDFWARNPGYNERFRVIDAAGDVVGEIQQQNHAAATEGRFIIEQNVDGEWSHEEFMDDSGDDYRPRTFATEDEAREFVSRFMEASRLEGGEPNAADFRIVLVPAARRPTAEFGSGQALLDDYLASPEGLADVRQTWETYHAGTRLVTLCVPLCNRIMNWGVTNDYFAAEDIPDTREHDEIYSVTMNLLNEPNPPTSTAGFAPTASSKGVKKKAQFEDEDFTDDISMMQQELADESSPVANDSKKRKPKPKAMPHPDVPVPPPAEQAFYVHNNQTWVSGNRLSDLLAKYGFERDGAKMLPPADDAFARNMFPADAPREHGVRIGLVDWHNAPTVASIVGFDAKARANMLLAEVQTYPAVTCARLVGKTLRVFCALPMIGAKVSGKMTRQGQFEPDDFEIEELQQEIDTENALRQDELAARPPQPSAPARVRNQLASFLYSEEPITQANAAQYWNRIGDHVVTIVNYNNLDPNATADLHEFFERQRDMLVFNAAPVQYIVYPRVLEAMRADRRFVPTTSVPVSPGNDPIDDAYSDFIGSETGARAFSEAASMARPDYPGGPHDADAQSMHVMDAAQRWYHDNSFAAPWPMASPRFDAMIREDVRLQRAVHGAPSQRPPVIEPTWLYSVHGPAATQPGRLVIFVRANPADARRLGNRRDPELYNALRSIDCYNRPGGTGIANRASIITDEGFARLRNNRSFADSATTPPTRRVGSGDGARKHAQFEPDDFDVDELMQEVKHEEAVKDSEEAARRAGETFWVESGQSPDWQWHKATFWFKDSYPSMKAASDAIDQYVASLGTVRRDSFRVASSLDGPLYDDRDRFEVQVTHHTGTFPRQRTHWCKSRAAFPSMSQAKELADELRAKGQDVRIVDAWTGKTNMAPPFARTAQFDGPEDFDVEITNLQDEIAHDEAQRARDSERNVEKFTIETRHSPLGEWMPPSNATIQRQFASEYDAMAAINRICEMYPAVFADNYRVVSSIRGPLLNPERSVTGDDVPNYVVEQRIKLADDVVSEWVLAVVSQGRVHWQTWQSALEGVREFITACGPNNPWEFRVTGPGLEQPIPVTHVQGIMLEPAHHYQWRLRPGAQNEQHTHGHFGGPGRTEGTLTFHDMTITDNVLGGNFGEQFVINQNDIQWIGPYGTAPESGTSPPDMSAERYYDEFLESEDGITAMGAAQGAVQNDIDAGAATDMVMDAAERWYEEAHANDGPGWSSISDAFAESVLAGLT